MKNILKKLMTKSAEKKLMTKSADNTPAKPKKPMPWEVVQYIRKNYNKAQQARILELLQKALARANPYGKNSLRG